MFTFSGWLDFINSWHFLFNYRERCFPLILILCIWDSILSFQTFCCLAHIFLITSEIMLVYGSLPFLPSTYSVLSESQLWLKAAVLWLLYWTEKSDSSGQVYCFYHFPKDFIGDSQWIHSWDPELDYVQMVINKTMQY